MKRPKNIQGDQLANTSCREVFAKLLPEAPPHRGIGMQLSKTSLPHPL